MPVVGPTSPLQISNHQLPDNVCGLEDACLGIDIGSHSTRACIWRMRRKTDIVVENPHYYGLGRGYTPCDFPSALYVFDDISQKVYLPDEEDPGRQWVSAKYVFYPLANASDALLEQYPLVHHLMERKDEPEFGRQLRRGMITLLSVLRYAADAICREHGLLIVKIGLTIPVQWGLEFEDVYRDLVMEVFDIDVERIYFFTETEALSRYLYKFHRHRLDPNDKHNAILFFDFGGHNMNGCLFGIARDQDRPDGNGFFRVGGPFGAGGGSEQWEHHVDEFVSDQYFQQTGVPPPPHERQHFLSEFQKQKGKQTDLRKAISVSFTLPDYAGTWRATLTLEDISQAWEKGLRGPLRTAKREISRLAEKMRQGMVSKPLVVVSGGTVRNPAVKSHMLALCNAKDIPVVFTDEFDVRITFDSAKVAKAAAYVVSETLTVEQFFRRGAAIGLQMRQARKQGEPKMEFRHWDDSGTLLLDTNGQHTARISVRRGDEFRLICDPFFGRLPNDQQQRVAANRTYDLVYLGKRRQGSWLFRLSLHGSGDEMELKLEQYYSKRIRMRLREENTLYLPLYLDGNSSCIQIGDRSRAISEVGLDLPPQPNDFGETVADNSDGQDSDTGSD
ncbi:hypothetical protein C8A03DRAFT_36422 [Achaetomium macrosporum]|uniref:Uncharacterized protein n=1 Tax=Achaetomium macrosporum TaxID=79813 RepID=A0AAN7H8Z4_9PEZI|nr:hypothetical protein C8A03DRAFT_36422 [Achaetomium macrosporum]